MSCVVLCNSRTDNTYTFISSSALKRDSVLPLLPSYRFKAEQSPSSGDFSSTTRGPAPFLVAKLIKWFLNLLLSIQRALIVPAGDVSLIQMCPGKTFITWTGNSLLDDCLWWNEPTLSLNFFILFIFFLFRLFWAHCKPTTYKIHAHDVFTEKQMGFALISIAGRLDGGYLARTIAQLLH